MDDNVINDAQWISFLKKETVHQGKCEEKTMQNNFLKKVQKITFVKVGICIIFLDIYFPGYTGFNWRWLNLIWHLIWLQLLIF